MHLRKAKLMFFWVRYPSSAVLKMYFPDIKFNKNNTAQLVKWFSNFRKSQGFSGQPCRHTPYITSDIFDLVRYSLERMKSWKTFLITEARFVYANENEVFEGSTTPFAEAVRAQETRVTMGVSES
ncbi:Homeobox protein prospero [Cyphomyrmex costatus]|uniref:Homeobox protein prospero n=1 Tax=Cyphomyrmex costatus TaxID=456900 RepID=A0A195CGA2_9HYME|nr:Homeobox protein prospero [Cyphomyrmex costatus]